MDKEEANSLKAGEKTLADLVALTVGTLGENMALRRVAHLKSDADSVMSCFVHAAGITLSTVNFWKYYEIT